MKSKVVKSMSLGLSAVTLAGSMNITALAAEAPTEITVQNEASQEATATEPEKADDNQNGEKVVEDDLLVENTPVVAENEKLVNESA